MKKRNLTPEQRAKADERKAARRALAARVGKMTAEERAALAARFPVTTIEGRVLSLHNQCLIALQGGATLVGGFHQWLDAGRCVRKGEHGMAIWCPTKRREKTADDSDAEPRADGERPGFILGTVFDVAQTDELTDANEEDQPRASQWQPGDEPTRSPLNNPPPDGWRPEDECGRDPRPQPVPAYATDTFEEFKS